MHVEAGTLSESSDWLLELRLSLESFVADWSHCDHLANYAANALSHGKPDAFLHANLLSTIINEILETIYWNNSHQGVLHLRFHEDEKTTSMFADIPVDADASKFFRESIDLIQNTQDAREAFRHSLWSESLPAGLLGLLEIVADYETKLDLVECADTDVLCLRLRMNLHETAA